ncbi:MAG: MerR family transcriptional regulator [Robiginitomaculum sp.]|nr:MAG: MerR family transcriptional regulator [Robiginitomaculum sp.]
MTQRKSTRAFRTISEAADELELQAHVLRFWESKFSEIQPMKRRGGRRFYRPEDIEFLRGIKVLLHREKHPIKDVQKLIRIRGPQSVLELGRSVEHAAKPRNVKDTNLVPRRIKSVIGKPVDQSAAPAAAPRPVVKSAGRDNDIVRRPGGDDMGTAAKLVIADPTPQQVDSGVRINTEDKANLEDALQRLKKLKSRWQEFT